MLVRIRGFKIFIDRHGKQRCYHRKTGHAIDLIKFPIGTASFFVECEKISALEKAKENAAPKAGTLGGLMQNYFSTEHFENLSDVSKKDYRKSADFLKPVADVPCYKLNTPLIADFHDKAHQSIGWRRANMVRTFLSEVFKFNIPRGTIDKNYALDVIPKPRPKGLARPNRPWTAEEQITVLKNTPPHVRPILAFMMCTGLDPSDTLNLKGSDIRNGTIWGKRSKTGTDVPIPITVEIEQILNSVASHDAPTIFANSLGRSWTYNGFSTVWYRIKIALEKEGLIRPGLTLKGLRHTVATTLRENGVHPREIADLLGQKTEAMALHYSHDALLANRNRETMGKLEIAREKKP